MPDKHAFTCEIAKFFKVLETPYGSLRYHCVPNVPKVPPNGNERLYTGSLVSLLSVTSGLLYLIRSVKYYLFTKSDIYE